MLTSNIGADVLVDIDSSQHESTDIPSSIKDIIMSRVATSLPPEFINRLDEFVFFRRLSKSALRDIVDVCLKEVQARLEDKHI